MKISKLYSKMFLRVSKKEFAKILIFYNMVRHIYAPVAQLEEHQAADLGYAWVRVLPGVPFRYNTFSSPSKSSILSSFCRVIKSSLTIISIIRIFPSSHRTFLYFIRFPKSSLKRWKNKYNPLFYNKKRSGLNTSISRLHFIASGCFHTCMIIDMYLP